MTDKPITAADIAEREEKSARRYNEACCAMIQPMLDGILAAAERKGLAAPAPTEKATP